MSHLTDEELRVLVDGLSAHLPPPAGLLFHSLDHSKVYTIPRPQRTTFYYISKKQFSRLQEKEKVLKPISLKQQSKIQFMCI
jgi:hypothetical protein